MSLSSNIDHFFMEKGLLFEECKSVNATYLIKLRLPGGCLLLCLGSICTSHTEMATRERTMNHSLHSSCPTRVVSIAARDKYLLDKCNVKTETETWPLCKIDNHINLIGS